MLSVACCGIAFLRWVMPEEAALESVSSRLLDAARWYRCFALLRDLLGGEGFIKAMAARADSADELKASAHDHDERDRAHVMFLGFLLRRQAGEAVEVRGVPVDGISDALGEHRHVAGVPLSGPRPCRSALTWRSSRSGRHGFLRNRSAPASSALLSTAKW